MWRPGQVRQTQRQRLLVLLHPEPRVSHRFDGGGRPVQFNVRRALAAEEVQEQFAGRAGDAGDGSPSPCGEGLHRPCPVQLQACTT